MTLRGYAWTPWGMTSDYRGIRTSEWGRGIK